MSITELGTGGPVPPGGQPRSIWPAVGRTLWYWPTAQDVSGGMTQHDYGSPQAQPLRMSIDYGHSFNAANGTITDHAGRRHVKHEVRIRQPGEPVPEGPQGYAEWMPETSFYRR